MKIKNLLQKRLKFTTVCVIVLVVSFFWTCYYTVPNLPLSPRGTYDYVEEQNLPRSIWMSVSWEDGAFYYTDQKAMYFISGTVESVDDNQYWFRCNAEKNKAVIPDQLMTRHYDDEITLMIGNKIRRFEKSADYTVTLGNYEYE